MPHAPGALPIVIGLQAPERITALEGYGLRAFLEAEFRARTACYPHSPFVLHMDAGAPMREIAGAAAAACGILVLEPPIGVLALFCHLLIDISVSDAAEAGAPPSGAEPLDEELIEFDAEKKVEVIHLQLLFGSDRLRQKISRFGLDEPAQDRLTHPQPQNRLMMRTDRFNLDASTLAPVAAVPAGGELSIEALFVRADELALVFQHRVHLLFRTVFALASVAAVFYGCFLTVAGTDIVRQNVLLVGYLLLIAASYGVYLYARHLDLHARFVEYRTLAEGLRVQHNWHACGIGRSAASAYLSRQPIDYQWIRLALRFVNAANAASVQSPDAASTTAVLKDWIDSQEQYFALGQARSARYETRLRYLVAIIFLVGLAASVLAMLAQDLTAVSKRIQLRISLVSFLCPAMSGAIVALVTKLGLLYQASHYGRMQAVFDQARRRLHHCPTGATIRIATALGEEALQEIESWAQFRRERGIDEPASPFRRPW